MIVELARFSFNVAGVKAPVAAAAAAAAPILANAAPASGHSSRAACDRGDEVMDESPHGPTAEAANSNTGTRG